MHDLTFSFLGLYFYIPIVLARHVVYSAVRQSGKRSCVQRGAYSGGLVGDKDILWRESLEGARGRYGPLRRVPGGVR